MNENEIVYTSISEEADGFDDSFANYRRELVTTVGYMIGVSEEHLSKPEAFSEEQYENLKKSTEATLVRALCSLRMQFFLNYNEIQDRRFNLYTMINKMPEYIDTDALSLLEGNGIDLTMFNVRNCRNALIYVSVINQYLLDLVPRTKGLFPDFIQFDFIKQLFLMPGTYAGHNGNNIRDKQQDIIKRLHEARGAFLRERGAYPYGVFIGWKKPLREELGYGNILFNDAKFCTLLYHANETTFKAKEYFIDAKDEVKARIYDFIDQAMKIAVFVDCENVDPYNFAATLMNLDAEALSKIEKIVLFDDDHTTTAWDHIQSVTNLPMVHKEIERVIDTKSLVDHMMIAAICEAHYKHDFDSVVIASSDSDFWSVISSVSTARFMVLNEKYITSDAVLAKLDEHSVSHYFMDDFALDRAQEFKERVLYGNLYSRISSFNESGSFGTLDTDELITAIFYEAGVEGHRDQIAREKQAFFEKYLKNGFTVKPVTVNGATVLKMELYKK